MIQCDRVSDAVVLHVGHDTRHSQGLIKGFCVGHTPRCLAFATRTLHMVLHSSSSDPRGDEASPATGPARSRIPILQSTPPRHTRMHTIATHAGRISHSPRRGDSAVQPVAPFRATTSGGAMNDFGAWLKNFEHWVKTKIVSDDRRRWHDIALRQLPLALDPKDAKAY